MAENVDNMVLRTVYIPVDVDRHLKDLAYAKDITKNALIRQILIEGLKDLKGQTFGERLEAAAARVEAAKPVKASKSSKTVLREKAVAKTATPKRERVAA